jgi:nanoRNase/pAp phosphatase (c-di-AMP/oligoRNAs hydrolase)
MLTSKFDNLINFLKNKSILITSHDLVDLDGLVSCLLFREIILKMNNNHQTSISFSEISRKTKLFINQFILKFPEFQFKFETDIDYNEYEVLIILDTNNLDLVNILNNDNNQQIAIPFIFIDHHLNLKKKHEMNQKSLNIIYENFSSTTELVYELASISDFDLSQPFKYLVVSAILTDTGFLRHSDTKTIRTIAQILHEDIEFQDVLSLFNKIDDISVKIARIKGLQRVELKRIDQWLLGITHVSSFGASVASMLINIGFDISIVYSHEKNNNYKVTARAKKSVCRNTGLHLGEIFSEMQDGSGGGHDGAASFNGEINITKFLKLLNEKIKKSLINS